MKTTTSKRNALIIPCYNEASRIDFNAYGEFLQANPNYDICFVNDGSTDNTAEVLTEMTRKFPNQAIVLDKLQNAGKAEAVRSGMNFMVDHDAYDSLGFLDADLSTGFVEYKHLVNELNENRALEMTFGSRKMGNDENIKRPPFRRFASFAFGQVIRAIVRLPIKDTQCGAKAFSSRMVRHCFKDSFTSRWLFDIEIFIRLRAYNNTNNQMNSYKEIALNGWEHVEGSKITLKDSLAMPTQLLQIAFNYQLAYLFNQPLRAAGDPPKNFVVYMG